MTDMMGMDDTDIPEMSDDEMMDPMEKALLERLDQLGGILNSLQQSVEQMTQAMNLASRPKKTTLVRDGAGRATHSITEHT